MLVAVAPAASYFFALACKGEGFLFFFWAMKYHFLSGLFWGSFAYALYYTGRYPAASNGRVLVLIYIYNIFTGFFVIFIFPHN